MYHICVCVLKYTSYKDKISLDSEKRGEQKVLFRDYFCSTYYIHNQNVTLYTILINTSEIREMEKTHFSCLFTIKL